jgi:hypothetical protein
MGNNRKTLEEINRYCSPNSILIIDRSGKLKRLVCPFAVMTLPFFPVSTIKGVTMVDAVKLSQDLLMVYRVDKVLYPYYYFIIIT